MLLVLCAGLAIKWTKGTTMPGTTSRRKIADIYALFSHALHLRSHFMLLPRVHVAHSPFSCARRFECHTVLSTSVYLFFAHFPLPERVSRHLLICARAQKPERFFPLLLLLTCIHEPYTYITGAFHTQVHSHFSRALESCTKP